jgi:hypothetical protein
MRGIFGEHLRQPDPLGSHFTMNDPILALR